MRDEHILPQEIAVNRKIASLTPICSDFPAAVPILHVITTQAVRAKGHGLRRFSGIGVIILLGEDIDLADGLAAVEINLQPGRETRGGS
jgi:hypothetical protein